MNITLVSSFGFSHNTDIPIDLKRQRFLRGESYTLFAVFPEGVGVSEERKQRGLRAERTCIDVDGAKLTDYLGKEGWKYEWVKVRGRPRADLKDLVEDNN